MDKEKTVEALIANEQTRFSEEHRDWLMSLEDEHLETLEPVEASAPDPEPEPDPEPDPEPEPKADPEPEAKNYATPEEFIEAEVRNPEIAAVLNESVQMRNEKIDRLVDEIAANEKCMYSKDELRERGKKDIRDLEALAALARKDDYSGRGGPRSNASGDDEAIPPAPKVSERLKEIKGGKAA